MDSTISLESIVDYDQVNLVGFQKSAGFIGVSDPADLITIFGQQFLNGFGHPAVVIEDEDLVFHDSGSALSITGSSIDPYSRMA